MLVIITSVRCKHFIKHIKDVDTKNIQCQQNCNVPKSIIFFSSADPISGISLYIKRGKVSVHTHVRNAGSGQLSSK